MRFGLAPKRWYRDLFVCENVFLPMKMHFFLWINPSTSIWVQAPKTYFFGVIFPSCCPKYESKYTTDKLVCLTARATKITYKVWPKVRFQVVQICNSCVPLFQVVFYAQKNLQGCVIFFSYLLFEILNITSDVA